MPVLLKCLQRSAGEQGNNAAIMCSDPCHAAGVQLGVLCPALHHNSPSLRFLKGCREEYSR